MRAMAGVASQTEATGTGARGPLGDERGVTMIEMLVAAGLMLIVAVGAMGLIGTGFRQNDSQYDRIAALDDARNGLLRMTSEIRSAVALESISAQILDVLVHFPDDPQDPYHWVRYKCVGNDQGNSQGLGGTCSRQDKTLHGGGNCDDDGTGPGCTVILRRVTKQGVDSFAEPCENFDQESNEEKHFCTKNNRTVQLSIFTEIPGAENPLELRTAVTIRNCLTNQDEVIPCVEST